jgi:Lamin Tail Domain
MEPIQIFHARLQLSLREGRAAAHHEAGKEVACCGRRRWEQSCSNANMIITEIMENPTKVNDARGEWLELYNNGTRRVNLKSWTLSDDKSDSIRIRTDLIVAPKQYIVLANSGKASLNGGLPKVDGTTPEDRALQWLVFSDKLKLTPNSEANKARLRQHFALLTWGFQPVSGDTLVSTQAQWNLSAANECDWYNKQNPYYWKFQCENGQVTTIGTAQYYSSYSYVGTLPPDLCWLTAMKTVSFPSAGMAGTLPTQLGWWTDLTTFDLSNGIMTSTIPSSIGAWTAIVTMNIQSNNKLSGTVPSTVSAWTALQTANFFGTNLTGVMPTFGVGGFCPKNKIGMALTADCYNGTGKAKISCICCSDCK